MWVAPRNVPVRGVPKPAANPAPNAPGCGGYFAASPDAHSWSPTWKTSSNGATLYAQQCLLCGTRGRAIKRADLVRDGVDLDVLPEFNEEFREDQYRRTLEAFDARREAERSDWFQKYDEYLATPAWEARRAAVMKRSAGLCEGCRERPATQVHHLTYEHVFDEFLWELVAICNSCHKRIHPHMGGDQKCPK